LKKRTKKLLSIAYASGDSATASQKSFASFLQKRRLSFSFLTFVPPAGNFQFVPSQDVIARLL
jgi:hypothetical protein